MRLSPTLRRARQAGFTMVEILIGMIIGLVGIVVIMQVFAVSEGFKRTASSGTDAQINGGLALYLLERDIRTSGYIINSILPLGCTTVRVWNNVAGTGVDMRMLPFEINPPGIPVGDANTDTILVASGSADSFVAGVTADQPGKTPTESIVLGSNREGFKAGDLFITVMPGATPSCVMHEATSVPNVPGNCGNPAPSPNTNINHAVVNYKSTYTGCTNVLAKYNSATGIKDSSGALVPPLNKANGGQAFNIGNKPTIKIYAVRGGNLTTCDAMASDCTVVANYATVVNDIVSMRAVYGKDFVPPVTPTGNPGDGKIDQWDHVALASSLEASRVLAAQIEIVARSAITEKPTNGTTCDATTNSNMPDRAQAWMGDAIAGAKIDISSSAGNWQCYRYKLFQTTVPLRNMIWRP